MSIVQTCLLNEGWGTDMMKHDTAEAGAGITQAAPAPRPAGRVASAQALQVRRPASETAALPADPFARRPWLSGRGSYRLSGRPAVFVLASLILAVLAALLTLGKLSDHVGRRPVLLTAIAVHAGSLMIFATATGVPELLSARVVQGLSTGAALGAIGAAMLDMDRELGTFANAVAPGMGSASGAILSALAVRFLPDPTHLIYLALIGVLALQATAIAAMRETVTPAPGALASLRPEIALPRAVRAPVLTAVPVLFAVWALAGLYGALGPALVHALTGSRDVVLGA